MTAVRVGLRSSRLCQFAAVVLAASACGGAAPVAQVSPAPSAAHSSTAAVTAAPAVTVSCPGRPTGGPTVLLGRAGGVQTVFDVSDPVHPRLLCRISGGPAHLYTGDTFSYLRPWRGGFEDVLHSMGSGNESGIATFPQPGIGGAYFGTPAWTADGSIGALPVRGVDQYGVDRAYVWLYWQASAGLLDSFTWPLADCICRFGLPQMTLALSPDGLYAVAGWPVGKGAAPLRVYRLLDRNLVGSFDTSVTVAIWGRTGHRLYVSGTGGSQIWTPEGAVFPLPHAAQWPYEVGLSPNGSQIAYTAYTDPSQPTTVRVYVYDQQSDATRILIDSRPRSEVTFVKTGWVWYLEEAACSSCAGGTAPTGKVFAMDLSVGLEQQVIFAQGEAPTDLAPAEFWPNA